jgi:DeoR family transcriptional regulator, aga operon transcriptional repressor
MQKRNRMTQEPISALERHQAIVEWITTKGRASVRELSRHFGVSEVTIRHDLTVLHDKSLLIRSRGSAFVNSRLGRELTIREKHETHHGVKHKLGQAVAAIIKDNERVILDSGTTTEEVAIALSQHSNLIVMTNGLNVASAPGIEVMITGGLLRRTSMSFYGATAEANLRYLHFDKVVLGVDGFDMNVGLTTHFESEASLNRLMCDLSDEVIVVTDSSKFRRRGFHAICGVSDIDVLLTDTGIPEQYAEQITRQGVRLHLVDAEPA